MRQTQPGGRWGQRTQSADSSGGLGDGPTYGGTGTQDAAPPDCQSDSQRMEPCDGLYSDGLGGGHTYGGTGTQDAAP